MTATGYVGGDPNKLNRTGYTKGQIVAANASGALQAVPGDVDGLFLATDSTEATGVDWEVGGGGGATLVVRKARITSGDITLNLGAGAFNQLVTLTLVIPAVVGDYVELEAPIAMSQSGNAFLDLAVVVGGAAVRYASTDTNTPATEGLPGLYKDPNAFRTSMGPWGFVVTSGDLSGGNVTFGVFSKGTTGTLYASATYPFLWTAKNFGAVNFA